MIKRGSTALKVLMFTAKVDELDIERTEMESRMPLHYKDTTEFFDLLVSRCEWIGKMKDWLV